MNIAGVVICAYRTYGDYSWNSLRRIIDQLALPYDPLSSEVETAVSSFLTQVPVMTPAEMRETGRVGLLTIDEDNYRRSTERLRRVDFSEGDTWLEALNLPAGQRLIAPQVQVGAAGVYLIGSVANGPESTRFVTFDTGIRAEGGSEPGSIVPEKCGRGVDRDLKWICLPGSCIGRCEPDGWVTGPGPAELIGCTCF
jgi:hypothetical protein